MRLTRACVSKRAPKKRFKKGVGSSLASCHAAFRPPFLPRLRDGRAYFGSGGISFAASTACAARKIVASAHGRPTN